MQITIKVKYKSISDQQSIELPKFSIITGKNGSGKSHFMEAVSKKEYAQVLDNSQPITKIKYIPFNGLIPKVTENCSYQNLMTEVQNVWTNLHSTQQNLIQALGRPEGKQIKNQSDWLLRNIGNVNYNKVLRNISERTGIQIESMTQDDIRQYMNFTDLAGEDVFTGQFATVFKAYHTRLEDNRYNGYLNKSFGESNRFLTEEQFRSEFGPPPWEIINGILEAAHLPYRVNDPAHAKKESDFNLKLSDPVTGLEISVNDLSTGEKVLMSLALAIYNTTGNDGAVNLLLIDEPDAALHPEFSGYLISALRHHIVEKANVSVILTTHSPTTLAASKDIEIFEMDQLTRWPRLTTKQDAIQKLLVGLDGVRVSSELRRQVFVESQYDVEYYERIYHMLKPEITSTRVPEFLPPHSKLGSNCADVTQIVSQLVEMGNDLVYGIIDYDGTNKPANRILVLGNCQRYSVENYIFDPIYIGLRLVRLKVIDISSFGFASIKHYVDCVNLTEAQLQTLIDSVTKSMKLNEAKLIPSKTIDGRQFHVSEDFYNIQGHKIEETMLSVWPQLNSIRRGKREDNILKIDFLDTVISEYSQFLSLDLVQTFNSVQ